MTRSTGKAEPNQTAPRLLVHGELHAGVEVAASPEQAHYLRTVLRRGSGDPVRLFNGVDGEWLSRVMARGRDRMSLVPESRLRPQRAEPGPWLLFALLKRDATDLVVRQAVELGCSRIVPVITERTNAARVNQNRLRAIAIEAAEQSERLTVPEVDQPSRLDTALGGWPLERRLFVALERTWTGATERSDSPGPAALLVGPEGGWTPAEREWVHRMAFVTPISLGPFVLRAETAAVAGLALLLGMGWAEYVRPT
jgi:16S rRNA (uracil1498-N3)-methyltransferase